MSGTTNFQNVLTMVQARPVAVEFTDEVSKMDAVDPDPGMRATLIAIEGPDRDGLYKLKFDMRPFEDHNRQVARPGYWDKNGQPTLTWFESSYYPADGIYTIYYSPEDSLFVTLLPDGALELVNAYKEEAPGCSYTAWLERIALAARKSS